MLARLLACAALAATPALLHAQRALPAPADLTVTRCDACAEWNEPQRPFKIHGNTWYVGTRGLSAVLVTSPAGHVLLDGALPESAPLIAASIRALGFRLEDVKFILNSHAHFDHAGGIAALQRASGAVVAAHPWSAAVLRRGRSLADDPQHGVLDPYPGVRAVRTVADGETVRVGPLALTAHFTGGHTPGGTSWSWRSCEDERCWDIVYADSQTPISADGFLFTRSSTYPTAVADFQRGHAVLERLPCDVLLAPHPGFSEVFERLAKRDAGDAQAFRDPARCRAYAAWARERLDERLARERGSR
jgi:metallo-beta-lactamase class B